MSFIIHIVLAVQPNFLSTCLFHDYFKIRQANNKLINNLKINNGYQRGSSPFSSIRSCSSKVGIEPFKLNRTVTFSPSFSLLIIPIAPSDFGLLQPPERSDTFRAFSCSSCSSTQERNSESDRERARTDGRTSDWEATICRRAGRKRARASIVKSERRNKFLVNRIQIHLHRRKNSRSQNKKSIYQNLNYQET